MKNNQNKNNEALINLPENTLINSDRESLDLIVLDTINHLGNSGDLLHQISLLTKFEYILDQLRKSIIKDETMKEIVEQAGGQTVFSINGVKFQIALVKEIKYSNEVKKIEEEIKLLQIKLKAQKETEKETGVAEITEMKPQLRKTIL